MGEEQAAELGTVASESHVLEQIATLVFLNHLEELGELFCAGLGAGEVLEHGVVEHGETSHLLVDKGADHVNQTPHDVGPLVGLGLKDDLEVGGGLRILELGNDNISDLFVVLDQKLSNQELGVSTLGKLGIGALQFACNLLPLFGCSVLDGGLNSSHGIVLEDEILDATGDDGEQLIDQCLSLLLGNVGLSSKSLPQLLCALEFVSKRLCGLALLGELLLLGMGFARSLTWKTVSIGWARRWYRETAYLLARSLHLKRHSRTSGEHPRSNRHRHLPRLKCPPNPLEAS
ncbi:hypothetical protein HG530_005186 [Fusarium avenaceum]|nr:hypothetical protein HG530_005186 [Fusarium avenaceum]